MARVRPQTILLAFALLVVATWLLARASSANLIRHSSVDSFATVLQELDSPRVGLPAPLPLTHDHPPLLDEDLDDESKEIWLSDTLPPERSENLINVGLRPLDLSFAVVIGSPRPLRC